MYCSTDVFLSELIGCGDACLRSNAGGDGYTCVSRVDRGRRHRPALAAGRRGALGRGTGGHRVEPAVSRTGAWLLRCQPVVRGDRSSMAGRLCAGAWRPRPGRPMTLALVVPGGVARGGERRVLPALLVLRGWLARTGARRWGKEGVRTWR